MSDEPERPKPSLEARVFGCEVEIKRLWSRWLDLRAEPIVEVKEPEDDWFDRVRQVFFVLIEAAFVGALWISLVKLGLWCFT